jgi:hypothetical protein
MPTTLFVLETTQAFAAFRYELSVQEKIEGRSITFTILGLKAPGLNLPSAGRAQFTREFSDLKGTYAVTVVGLDGRATSFPLSVGKGRVELKGKATGTGLMVTTDAAEFAKQ